MAISQKSIDFLVMKEDGSKAYYEKTEEHWDWPGGQSGPTVGAGYDCGYVSLAECRADWTGIVDDATLANILKGVGYTGSRAHFFVNTQHDAVTVTWAQAMREFTEREIPKWEMRCEAALPNFTLLPPDSAGALLSVTYNRGTGGFHSHLPRYREMVTIAQLMAAKDFGKIPAQIASMARLWREGSDLWQRRHDEAKLFQEGLDAQASHVAG